MADPLTAQQIAYLQSLLQSTSPGQSANIGGNTYGTLGVQTYGDGGGYTPNSVIQYDPNNLQPGAGYSYIDPATGQVTGSGSWENGGAMGPMDWLTLALISGGALGAFGGLGGAAGSGAGLAGDATAIGYDPMFGTGAADSVAGGIAGSGAAGAAAGAAGSASGAGATGGAAAGGAGAAGAGAAGNALGGAGSALGGLGGLGSALGGLGGLGAALGGLAGAMQGPQQQTVTRTMDPKLEPYVLGPNGVLPAAQALYQQNPSGINANMQAGWARQLGILNDPATAAAYQKMTNVGTGLLGNPVASNPFTAAQKPQMGSNLLGQYMGGSLNMPHNTSGLQPIQNPMAGQFGSPQALSIPSNINLPSINGQPMPSMPQIPGGGMVNIPIGQVGGQPLSNTGSGNTGIVPQAPGATQPESQATQSPRSFGSNTIQPGETQAQFLARLNGGAQSSYVPHITPSAFHTDATTGLDTTSPEYQQTRMDAYAQNQSDAAAGLNQTPWDARSMQLGPLTTTNSGPMNFGNMNGSSFQSALPDISKLPKLPDTTGGLNVPGMQYQQYTGDPKRDALIAESNWQLASSFQPGGTYAQTLGYGDPRNQQLGAGYSNVGAFTDYGVMPGDVNPARNYNLGNYTVGDLASMQNEYGMVDSALKNQMNTYNNMLTGYGAWKPGDANIHDLSNASFGMKDTLSNIMGNWDQFMASPGNFYR